MNTSASKDARKREIEQSPSKKKFKNSSISKDDLDAAIANGIKLALQEQQSALNVIVASAVQEAVDSFLVPALRDLRTDIQKTKDEVKDIRGDLDRVTTSAKSANDRVNSLQATAREDRRTVIQLQKQLDELTEKLTDLEDRSRRNNVRIVGLPEGAEGSDAVSYLKANLPLWIPSLKGQSIDIERAHRVYHDADDAKPNKPRTLIFKLLRWQDRSDILSGAHQAFPVKSANDDSLLFFPDYSRATTSKRKSFDAVKKKAKAMGLHNFLRYPAVLKIDHGGKKLSFQTPEAAENFIGTLSRRSNRTAAANVDEDVCVSDPRKGNRQAASHGGEGNLVDMKD